MAGDSARTGVWPRRGKADRLLPPAAPVERGVADDESTARVLAALSGQGWRIFHHTWWPGRAHAVIDHVLVGPGGVFVVDTLTWTGRVDVKGGALRKDGRRRPRTVVSAAAAAMAVGELVPGVSPKVIHPVICLVRPEPVFGWCGDVMVCSTQNVAAFIASRPRVLEENQMAEIAGTLARSLHAAVKPAPPARTVYAGDRDPDRETVARLRHLHRRRPRLPRARLPRSVRVAAGVVLLAVAITGAARVDLPTRVGDFGSGVAHRVIAPTEPIGATVTAPGLIGRPELEVRAERPLPTSSELPGVYPSRGHELLAVPVTVRNSGEVMWSSSGDLRAAVTDSSGAEYSADPAYTSVRGGATFPGSLSLPVGATVHGLVVFEVPKGTHLERVRLRVGPSLPVTLRWAID